MKGIGPYACIRTNEITGKSPGRCPGLLRENEKEKHMVFDTILRGGTVIDGSGRPGFTADVAFLDGKIAAVGDLSGAQAKHTLDVAGKLVTPGFLDIHRHADAAVFRPGFGEAELFQGLTTIVNGNCGLSIAPSGGAFQKEIFDYLTPVTGPIEARMQPESMASYLQAVKTLALPLNVGMLAGGGTVRAQAAGFGVQRLEGAHYTAIHKALEQALSDGALGVSLGLGYAPECFYTTQELIRALAPLQNSGVPVTVHMRQEGSGVVDALREMIAVGKALHTPIEISHLKSIGRENWRKATPLMLQLMQAAREDGVEINADAYPYTAGSTQLIHILPPECQEGGLDALSENLKDPAFRAKLRRRMETGRDFENISLLVGWDNIVASSVIRPEDRAYEGKTIAEIAKMQGKDPYDCAFDLLSGEHCAISMIDFITAEEDIEAILRDDTTCVISDSTYPTHGLLHPRVYGTYARLFERYVRQRGTISVEKAVRKVTSLPAKRLRLAAKGRIAPGMDADVNVFALERLHEAATYDHPDLRERGMEHVFLAGEAAILHGKRTAANCGKALEEPQFPQGKH